LQTKTDDTRKSPPSAKRKRLAGKRGKGSIPAPLRRSRTFQCQDCRAATGRSGGTDTDKFHANAANRAARLMTVKRYACTRIYSATYELVKHQPGHKSKKWRSVRAAPKGRKLGKTTLIEENQRSAWSAKTPRALQSVNRIARDARKTGALRDGKPNTPAPGGVAIMRVDRLGKDNTLRLPWKFIRNARC